MSANFSSESHFESKIKQGSIKNQSPVIRFNTSVFEPSKFAKEKGLRKICKDQFKYSDFVEINKLHCEYLNKIKENSNGTNSKGNTSGFLENIYKAELTGASVKLINLEDKGKLENKINLEDKDKLQDKIGFIVEERKNSLVVIFKENEIKIFPKKSWNFSILFEGIEYLFISELLKKGRLFNK